MKVLQLDAPAGSRQWLGEVMVAWAEQADEGSALRYAGLVGYLMAHAKLTEEQRSSIFAALDGPSPVPSV